MTDYTMPPELIAFAEKYQRKEQEEFKQNLEEREKSIEAWIQSHPVESHEALRSWCEQNPQLVKSVVEPHIWEMNRLDQIGWDWGQYQLDNEYSPYGVFESPTSYAMFKPPEPLHRKSGKRRDTKPKAKPRKTVKLGRRDSRRK